MCITQVESASFPFTENKQKKNKNKNNLHTYADALHINPIFNALRVVLHRGGTLKQVKALTLEFNARF